MKDIDIEFIREFKESFHNVISSKLKGVDMSDIIRALHDAPVLYTVDDLVRIFDLSTSLNSRGDMMGALTVRGWVKKGYLKSNRLPGGSFRFTKKHIEDFLNRSSNVTRKATRIGERLDRVQNGEGA